MLCIKLTWLKPDIRYYHRVSRVPLWVDTESIPMPEMSVIPEDFLYLPYRGRTELRCQYFNELGLGEVVVLESPEEVTRMWEGRDA